MSYTPNLQQFGVLLIWIHRNEIEVKNYMKNTFYCSDIHFGHRAILAFSPTRIKTYGMESKFSSDEIAAEYKKLKDAFSTNDEKRAAREFFKTVVSTMDQAIIERWNDMIGFSDDVYCMGDFSFHGFSDTKKILSQLNGRIHLVRGNHDKNAETIDRWEWVKDYAEVVVEGQKIVMLHYPIAEHANKHHGSWHTFGHVHGKDMGITGKALDVGVESLKAIAISHSDLKVIMDKLPVIAHHDAEREKTQSENY